VNYVSTIKTINSTGAYDFLAVHTTAVSDWVTSTALQTVVASVSINSFAHRKHT